MKLKWLMLSVVLLLVRGAGGWEWTLDFRDAGGLPATVEVAPGTVTPEGLACGGGNGAPGLDYCRIPAAPAPFSTWERGTVEMDVTVNWDDSATEQNVLFCTGTGVLWGTPGTFHLQREGSALRFIVIDADGTILRCSAENSVDELKDGRSHKLTVTWDTASGLSLYIDGFLRGSLSAKFTVSAHPLDWYIGNSHILDGAVQYYFPADAVLGKVSVSDYVRTDIRPVSAVRTVLYPAGHGRNGISWLVNGVPTHWLFFYCAAGTRPASMQLVLDLPPLISIVGWGQTRVNKLYPEKPAMRCEELPDGTRRYRIDVDHPEELNDSLVPTINHMVYVEPDATLLSGSYQGAWRVDCDGVPGESHPLQLKVLEPLEYGDLPREFQLSLFFGGSLTVPQTGGHLMIHPDDDASVAEPLRLALSRLGVSTGQVPGVEAVGEFQGYHANFHVNWLQCSEAPRRVGPGGEVLDGYGCPEFLGRRGADLLADQLPELQRFFREKGIRYTLPDYEMERYLFQCFCSDCIAAFEQFSSLDAAGMSGSEILKTFPEEWSKFLCAQNARMLEQLTLFIRRIDPGVKIYLCANYVFDPDYTLKVGHDVRLFEPFVDAHMPMIYYDGAAFFRKMNTTCRELRKPVLPHLCPNDVVYLPRVMLTPAQMRMNLLAAFICGAKGAAFYPGADSFDAEYYAVLNRTQQEIARLERYLDGAEGVDAELTTTPKLETKVWKRSNGRLLALFHYGSVPVTVQGRLRNTEWEKSEASVLRNLSANGRLVDFRSEGDEVVFYIDLPPGEAVFLDFSPAEAAEKLLPPQRTFAEDEEAFLCGNALPEVIRDSEFFEREGNELIIRSGTRRFRLNVAAGTLVGTAESGALLFADCFYTAPGFAESRGAYQLTAQSRDVFGLKLNLSRAEPEYPGVTLHKEMVFAWDGSSVAVTYTLENGGTVSREIRLWIRNLPFGTEGGRQSAENGGEELELPRSDNLLFVSGYSPRIPWEQGNGIVGTPAAGEVGVLCDKKRIAFDTTNPGWSFVYLWNGHFLTVELASDPLNLAVGESRALSTAVIF